MKEGTVSVIIPCYNYGHFLRESIDSVIRQSYPHWECIIIDDGSGDNTREVADALCRQDSRIKYIHQPNQGAAAARNRGLRQSTGEFVQFLDADDLLESEKFLQQVRYLQHHPAVDIIYGDAKAFYGSAGSVVTPQETIQGTYVSGAGSPVVNDFLAGNLPIMVSLLFRRKILAGVGLFIEKIKASEDYEFWLRCAFAEKHFFFLAAPGTHALKRGGHESLSTDTYKMFVGTVLAHRALMPRTGGKYKALLKKRQEELVHLYAGQLYKAAVYVDFRKHGWELLRAAAVVKHPFVSKMMVVALVDKTKQLLSSARRRGLKPGKA